MHYLYNFLRNKDIHNISVNENTDYKTVCIVWHHVCKIYIYIKYLSLYVYIDMPKKVKRANSSTYLLLCVCLVGKQKNFRSSSVIYELFSFKKFCFLQWTCIISEFKKKTPDSKGWKKPKVCLSGRKGGPSTSVTLLPHHYTPPSSPSPHTWGLTF